nr:methionyl-tRNA formyltransferase [Bacteroidales bacterium]
PEEVWSMPKFGTFNLHAALLPQYRGAAPINWAVINGERMTGVTTFMIDKDIDTGGILFRSEARIAGTDTAGDVHDRLMALGSDLVVQTVEAILEGNAETRVQRSFIQGSEVLKPAPKLTRELCRLDWSDTTRHLYNLIRGLSPYPTAFTTLTPVIPSEASPVISSEASPVIPSEAKESVTLKIFFAEKVEGAPAAAPGTVTSDGKTWLHIATGDGALSVTDVQLSGKKRMGVQDFLRGFRDPESYIAQ